MLVQAVGVSVPIFATRDRLIASATGLPRPVSDFETRRRALVAKLMWQGDVLLHRYRAYYWFPPVDHNQHQRWAEMVDASKAWLREHEHDYEDGGEA